MKLPLQKRSGRTLRHPLETPARQCRAMRGPDHYRQRVSGQMAGRSRVQTSRAAPPRDLRIGKTEPTMGVLLTQELELMRREIDKDEDTAWTQDARGFGNRRAWPVGVVQHLVYDDCVERRIGQRQLIHVSQPHRSIFDP